MYENKYKDLSILIVEDEEVSRLALVDLLSLYFGFIYSAEDGCEGLELITKYHPDVIISDIQMPCMSGLEMMETVKKTQSNAVFLFISAFHDTKYLINAIDLKSDAYILKPIDVNLLLEKLDKALQNRVIYTSKDDISSISLEKYLHKSLSAREHEVFLDIAKGIKPNNIADKYSIKPKTISTYRKRILEKMSLNSNAEIIRYAIENRLI